MGVVRRSGLDRGPCKVLGEGFGQSEAEFTGLTRGMACWSKEQKEFL